MNMAKVWWEEYKEAYIEAMSYWWFLNRLQIIEVKDKTIHEFFLEYEKTSFAAVIFESNTIEHEGLSEYDTKKIVFEGLRPAECPVITHLNSSMAFLQSQLGLDLQPLMDTVKMNLNRVNFEVTYHSKMKEYAQVKNQLIALLRAKAWGLENFLASLIKLQPEAYFLEILHLAGDDEKKRDRLFRLRKEKTPSLLSLDMLKEIHQVMSHGLDNNDNGLPGEYRREGAYINSSTIFLEPALIGLAVNKVIDEHTLRVNDSAVFNPILEACKVSADIVRIHPFGDCNGRLSRVVLNLVLISSGLTFFIALRGDSKHRKRYLTSMKQYFQSGNLKGYVAIVSKTLLEQVKDINRRLAMANLPQIEKEELSEEKRKYYLAQLEYYLDISKDRS
jgi:fido (protein-threonine AMPylation protein)